MARELGVGFRATSGPVIAKAGDLAALLTNLEDRDVLFIDEIHRLNPAVEEILYPAMEDYQLDLIIGEGPAARSVKIDLARFTLIGATTRTGLLTTPLRDRFGIPVRLNFYTHAELETIVTRGAGVLKVAISPDGAAEIARRSRGTPRIAGRLLRRVRDFAAVDEAPRSSPPRWPTARCRQLEVDSEGLDALDHRYLSCIARNYDGGPVGIETISAALSEPRDALEEIVEPYPAAAGLHRPHAARPRAHVAGLQAPGADGPRPRRHAPDRPVRRGGRGGAGDGKSGPVNRRALGETCHRHANLHHLPPCDQPCFATASPAYVLVARLGEDGSHAGSRAIARTTVEGSTRLETHLPPQVPDRRSASPAPAWSGCRATALPSSRAGASTSRAIASRRPTGRAI